MDERIVCYIDEIETEVDEISGNAQNIEIITEDGREYRLFKNHDDAKTEVRNYWNDTSDKELIAIIGTENIAKMLRWGESLDDWIEAQDVEAHLASYDGAEHEFESEHDELCYYTLAYRIE